VQVHLVRINPIGAYMDAAPDTVVSVMREMRANGHAIVGMKILGQGELRNRQDEALRCALSLDLLDAFTIGAESKFEQEDLIRRIAASSSGLSAFTNQNCSEAARDSRVQSVHSGHRPRDLGSMVFSLRRGSVNAVEMCTA